MSSLERQRKCCQIVKPATVLAWFRQLGARKYDSSRSKLGRPRKRRDIRKLVVEMALANLGYVKPADMWSLDDRNRAVGRSGSLCFT